jgi:hypothetical protein
VDPDIDIEACAQAFRRLHQQRPSLGDHAANVIGHATVGEGDMRPPLEEHNAGPFGEPAGAGRGAGAASHAADDQNLLR